MTYSISEIRRQPYYKLLALISIVWIWKQSMIETKLYTELKGLN